MRSLTWKLTLAFLAVGLTVAILVAGLTGQRTRSAFDRFVSEHDQALLLDAVTTYYAANGRWDGVAAPLSQPPLALYTRGVTLLDAEHRVVVGSRDFKVGQAVAAHVNEPVTPVQVSGRTVGFLLLTGGQTAPPPGPPRPDAAFLQRVGWAAALNAAIAAAIALVMGGLLARSLTQPLHELTAATRAMAAGHLEQRVTVRSRDEVGQLAQSFNQMSADLVSSSQARKQMTADLAHDLRTPLSILRGYTEGLKDGRLTATPALFTIMHDEVTHLQRLVEDLRLLSLADAGELTLNRRAVDPLALLERTALAYVVQAEEHGIALELASATEMPSISVDTDRLTQVLNNLVSNALRYTERGTIRLGATAAAGWVRLTIADTGRGIAPEDLPLIFDRFYRGDKSRQRIDSNASGLGLAIARAIVEAHGGTLSVASTMGQGTTFTVALPVA